MENACIFVVRTPIMRESNGSHLYKAGFFCFRIQGIFPIRYAACLYRAFKKRIPRASDGVRSDIWQVAFLSAYTRTPSNYAYQHTYHKKGADRSNGAIAARRRNSSCNCLIAWRRGTRINQSSWPRNLERDESAVFGRDSQKLCKVQNSNGGVAQIRRSITRSASATSRTLQVIPKHISSLTLLAVQPARV